MRKKLVAFAIAVAASSTLAHAHTARADDKAECVAASEKAQQQKDDRKFIKAREQFLVCSRDVCPSAVKKDCADQVADLDKRTPSVVVHAKDKGGQDLVAVKVTSDGATLAEQLDGHAITLDPGVHTFRFETAGNEPIEQKIVLAEGEHDRAITISFGVIGGGSGGGDLTPPRKHGAPIGAFIVGAVGLAAMGVGAAFWGVGLGQKGADETTCAPKAGGAGCADVDDIHTKLVIGDVAFFSGVAILTAGVVWAVVHYTSGSKEAPAAAMFDVAPTTFGRGAVATTTIRW